jgi:hypothetical protein
MTKVNKSSIRSQRQIWMAVSKHWCKLEVDTNKHEDFKVVFANHLEEDEISSYYNRDSKTTKERSRVEDLLQAKFKTPKEDMLFQLI